MGDKPKDKFLDDFGKMFGSAISAGMHGITDARKSGEEWIKECVSSFLEDARVIRREEFEALKETVRRLEDELASLKEEKGGAPAPAPAERSEGEGI